MKKTLILLVPVLLLLALMTGCGAGYTVTTEKAPAPSPTSAQPVETEETQTPSTPAPAKDYGDDEMEAFIEAYLQKVEDGVYYCPMDRNGECYFSVIKTYSEITGGKCLRSADAEGKVSQGFTQMSLYYVYDLNATEKDEYVTYLASKGYVLQKTHDFKEGKSEYYYPPEGDLCLDLYVPKDGKTLTIYPKCGYVE